MTTTPKKPCRKCKRALTTGVYCAKCQPMVDARRKATARVYDDRRGKTAERGYDAAWNKVRIHRKEVAMWVCECDRCKAMGRVLPVKKSDPVHHIVPVDKRRDLRLDVDNLLSMARHCHEVEEGRARDKEYEDWLGEGEGGVKSLQPHVS